MIYIERSSSKIILIFRESFRRFFKDRCDIEARSLSFITILLIVPFFLVSVVSIKFFTFYNSLKDLLINFISNFFLPEKSQEIITYLDNFQYQTSTLNIFNISLMLLVSFWLFSMITRNVNRNSNLIYNYLNLTIKYFNYGKITSVLYSILINWLLIFILYYIVPHEKIKFRYSLISALIIAAVLWITRNGYNFYFKMIPQINILYGSLSFIPIFLIWIYISWLIVLYGLELNYSFHFYNK